MSHSSTFVTYFWTHKGWYHVTGMWCHLYCVLTYPHFLLVDKDLHECQNISINFSCAIYMSLSSGDLLTFSVRNIHVYSYFVLSMVWYFPFQRSFLNSSKWLYSQPRWSQGNVLSSRSKVHGFKSGWGRWTFSGRKNPEHKPSGRDFKLGVPSLRFQAR